ncbi:MAG TPA: aminotransferase class V-fold PLP-dependent enzyme, partial [Burkholderiaceae bacterium]|nr:aminotransferase class V-fold PLP-dependent enzyme [Burkholderiaceae bacterium]
WNTAGWIDLSSRIGNAIAPLVGAGTDELIVGDSTSVNLYKALSAAIAICKTDAPMRKRIVSERSNFPTDLYIADSLAREHGFTLELIEAEDLGRHLNDDLAVLMLTHVNYCTGRMHDMARVSRAAHKAGALVIWDLAHSAGAVPVALHGGAANEAADFEGQTSEAADFEDQASEAADFAVGCGYKYLNGGPGAPAFVWAHPRHLRRMDREQWRQPLSGWLGHAAPFEFTPDYRPAPGIQRFVCGTPPVLAMAALECGVAVFTAAEALGGLAALRAKSLALGALFIELVEARCAGHGLALVTPRDDALRGSQVSFGHAQGFAVMQALIARGVIGDFRAGRMAPPAQDGTRAIDIESADLLRFGFTPLYTRFIDAWDAVEQLREVLASGEWREARFNQRAAVT